MPANEVRSWRRRGKAPARPAPAAPPALPA